MTAAIAELLTLGRALLAGDVRDGAVIRIGYSGGELSVSYENQA